MVSTRHMEAEWVYVPRVCTEQGTATEVANKNMNWRAVRRAVSNSAWDFTTRRWDLFGRILGVENRRYVPCYLSDCCVA